MRLPSPEALLLCSILNTGDYADALRRGVTPDHFVGYRAEWEFLARYAREYHDIPSPDVLCGAFPAFPYSASPTEVAWFCDQVITRAGHRAVKAALLSAADRLASGDLEGAVSGLRSVDVATRRLAPVDAIRTHIVADELTAGEVDAVAYPWRTLQGATGGMRPGDYAVFAARTTVGKSWGLIYAAAAAAMAGRTVLYYSLEMPTAQIAARVHAVIANLLGHRLSHTALHQRSVDHIAYKRLLASMEERVPGRLNVLDTSAGRITPASISAADDADLVIVDHIGLMSDSTGRRAVDDWRVMAAISNALKEQAIALGTPILVASQINREGGRGRGLPGIADLAQSDAIGQDADVLVTMRRMAGPVMKYAIQKNRHGMNELIFHSRFEPDLGRLNEITAEQAEDLCDDVAS